MTKPVQQAERDAAKRREQRARGAEDAKDQDVDEAKRGFNANDAADPAWPIAAEPRTNLAIDPKAIRPNVDAFEVKGAVPSADAIAQARKAIARGTLRGARANPHMDALEAALKDPKVKVLNKVAMGGGINGTFRVTLSNGMQAVWKPTAAEDMRQLRTQMQIDHQSRREVAAYLVDKAMGHLAGVPPAVYRDLGGESGALIADAGDIETAAAGGYERAPEYDILAIYDHVIGNLDRHGGNLLVTADGHLIPIDHGMAFPEANARQGWMNFIFTRSVKLKPSQRVALEALELQRPALKKQLMAVLVDGSDKDSRDHVERSLQAMFERVDQLLADGQTSGWWRK